MGFEASAMTTRRVGWSSSKLYFLVEWEKHQIIFIYLKLINIKI